MRPSLVFLYKRAGRKSVGGRQLSKPKGIALYLPLAGFEIQPPEAVTPFKAINPRPVINKGPLVNAKAVRPLADGAMKLFEVLFHQFDTVGVINNTISLHRTFGLDIHGDTNFGEIPLYIVVIIADIAGNIVDFLRKNHVIIAIRIEAPFGIVVIREVIFRREVIQLIRTFTRFHPTRHVE